MLVSKERAICVAETPFQMLGILSFIANDVSQGIATYDLIIRNNFSRSHDFYQWAQNSHLFNRVLHVNYSAPEGKHGGTDYLRETVLERAAAMGRLDICGLLPVENNYDVLVCSSATHLTRDIKQICVPNGYSIFLDDGNGSHTGNVFKSFMCPDLVMKQDEYMHTKKDIASFLGRLFLSKILPQRFFYNIKMIGLFSPTQSDRERYREISCFPLVVNSGIVRQIRSILGNDQIEKYEGKKAIFITLPDDGCVPENMLNAERDLINRVTNICDEVIIRPHPRCMNLDVFDQNKLDSALPFWEGLLASGCVNGESILLGGYSTAQFTPKKIFNYEPWVIFLHKLIKAKNNSNLDQIIDELRDAYTSKEKVIVPETVDSFEEVFKSILARRQFIN